MKNKFKEGGVYARKHTLKFKEKFYSMSEHYFKVTKRLTENVSPNYPYTVSKEGFLALTPCDKDGSRDSFYHKNMIGYRCTIKLRDGVETVNTMGTHNDNVSGSFPEMLLTAKN